MGDYTEKSGYQSARLMLLSGNMPEDIAITGFDGIDLAPQFLFQLIERKTNKEAFRISAKVHWRESVRVKNKRPDNMKQRFLKHHINRQ